MVVRKFNYFRFISFIVILVGIIVGIVVLIKKSNYKKTYEYKLLEAGYSQVQISTIEEELTNSQIDKLLTMDYDDNIIGLLTEKYFIFDNLDKYLEYKKEKSNYENSKIISIINTKANIDWFDYELETDASKNELMLVNRIYGLSSSYEPENIVDIPTQYAYTGKQISNNILDKIITLINSAKNEGYTFVVSEGYRSYKAQEDIYNFYANNYGKSDADEIAARPGHSEYQTGLSFDLVPYNEVIENPYEDKRYLWLKDNAHKYGFIFRLEKEKEELTGFNASAWRLRYVGESAASIIYNENICFEEYYAYFVENAN